MIQHFQKYVKTLFFRQAFRQKKNCLKIALQVSKLGFSPIVMPKLPWITEKEEKEIKLNPLKAGFIQKSIPNLLFQPQFRKSLEHVSKFICGAVIFNIRMPRCQVFMAVA